MSLNRAQIIGHLTRDPEVRQTPQGISVATFGVATNFVWTDQSGVKQEKVEFHNIVCWRKLAETASQYLKKGARVYIEGRIQTRDWTGDDGVKRYRTEIVADSFIMLDRRSDRPLPEYTPSSGFANYQAQQGQYMKKEAGVMESREHQGVKIESSPVPDAVPNDNGAQNTPDVSEEKEEEVVKLDDLPF